MLTAHVDADSIVYESGFAVETNTYTTPDGELHGTLSEARVWCKSYSLPEEDITKTVETEPLSHALKLVKNLLLRVQDQTKCDEMKVYIGGVGNYRDKVATTRPYKGNRPPTKPLFYDKIREYLVNRWDAEVVDGIEAEDAVSIQHMADIDNSIIVAIDKDLLNTPGKHYNWRSDRLFDVTETEAKIHFYHQLLTGDSTDNIPGCAGIGKVKAERILHGLTTEEDLYRKCYETYQEVYGDDATSMLMEQARLLHILRTPDDVWEPPTLTVAALDVPITPPESTGDEL